MLVNIGKGKKSINGISNGGVMVTDQEGDFPGFFTVYYNPESLMNILALSNTRKRFRITMDTSKEVAILVHIAKNIVMKFVEVDAGLYIWRPEFNNKLNFTKRELDRIYAARKLYINLGIPGYPKFFSDLENNRIRDVN